MISRTQVPAYFIGWDVGGWNCDKNGKSRDALVILDAGLNIVGTPWRNNLRDAINHATDNVDWIMRLFALCEADAPSDAHVTLAIDAPLGYSEAFVRLVTKHDTAGEIGHSESNPYLYRYTERFLFKEGLKPLSAIKDMIGSQTTKGIHALAKFAPHVLHCGVWSDGQGLIAIEAYPSVRKHSDMLITLHRRFGQLGNDVIRDLDDALTCALLAYLFATKPDKLIPPGADVPTSEGWIWVPADALGT